MADNIELVDCPTLTPREAATERERILLEKRAYNAARLKAEEEKIRRESEERKLQILTDLEEDRYFNLLPDRRYVATYWLTERSMRMRLDGLRYKFKIPEMADPEMTLQLWRRDRVTDEEMLVGNVGDLYTVWLKIPESRRSAQSRMYYSIFDVGHHEKAYSIPAEAWQTYMMFRSDEEEDRVEIDTRMWYIAIGDKGQLEGHCTMEHFRTLNLEQLKDIMNNLMPGLTYDRPTSEEALLCMNTGTVFELLRTDEEEKKEKVKLNLEGKFNAMDISPSHRVLRSKC